MNYAPIALFAYNRPEHLHRTVEALLRNPESVESDLYVFSDGPKRDSDREGVEAVRAYIASLTGFKNIKVVEQKGNIGLAQSIISGVTEVLNERGTLVVLEDDMISSPHFLAYMNNGLNLYAKHTNVSCIHGYRYPIGKVDKPFFMRGADCWGWATWKHAWEIFNPDGAHLLSELKSRDLVRAFNHNGSYPYDRMLRDQIAGKNDSWAIRWKASAFLKDYYTLYYKEAMVKNIGNDDSGTHSKTTDVFDVELATKYAGLQLQEVKEDEQIAGRISKFYKALRPTLWQRIKAKLS